jgi:hypothetical protein
MRQGDGRSSGKDGLPIAVGLPSKNPPRMLTSKQPPTEGIYCTSPRYNEVAQRIAIVKVMELVVECSRQRLIVEQFGKCRPHNDPRRKDPHGGD